MQTLTEWENYSLLCSCFFQSVKCLHVKVVICSNFGFPTRPSRKHEASNMDHLCLLLPPSCPRLKIAIMY